MREPPIARLPWGRRIKGLSRITGERGADLEEEVFLVAVPLSLTLDDFDGVVDAFNDASIEWVSAPGQESVRVTLQVSIAPPTDESKLSGKVRIAAPFCFGDVVMPKALMRIRETLPRLHVDLVLNDKIVAPTTEGVDISMRLGRIGDGSFVAHRIGSVDQVLVSAQAYLDRHGPIESPADLSNHPFVGVKGLFGNAHLPLLLPDGTLEHARIQPVVVTNSRIWKPRSMEHGRRCEQNEGDASPGTSAYVITHRCCLA